MGGGIFHSKIQLPHPVRREGGELQKKEVQHAKKTRIPKSSGKSGS